MLDPDSVVFDAKPFRQAPHNVTMRFKDVTASDEVHRKVLEHGIKRLLDSIRDSEKKNPGSVFQKQLDRMEQIASGQLWSAGGGGTLPAEEIVRRDVVAGWLMRWQRASKQEAEKQARDHETALHAIGSAMFQHRHGVVPDGEEVRIAADKVRAKVDQQVRDTLAAQQADDLDI